MSLKAYYCSDLIGEGDGRDFGVEIYSTEDGEYSQSEEFVFFKTLKEALVYADNFNKRRKYE